MSEQETPTHPLPVMILQHPKPAIVVDGVDITPAVAWSSVTFQDGQMFAEFGVKAEAFVDFPCHVTRVEPVDAAKVLAGVTADDIDGWIQSGGMSSTPGQRVLRHLRDILEAGAT